MALIKQVRIKFDKLYFSLSKNQFTYKWIVWAFTQFTFLFAFLWPYFTGGITFDKNSVNWFAYLTNLSVVFVALYYNIWAIATIFKSDTLLKIFYNVYLRLTVMLSILMMIWFFTFLAFIPQVINMYFNSSSWEGYVQWLTLTIFKHVLMPFLVWFEFRSSKITNTTTNLKLHLVSFWLYIYGIIIGTLSLFNIPSPYIFLDWTEWPIFSVAIFFMVPFIYHYMMKFLLWEHNRNINYKNLNKSNNIKTQMEGT